MLDKSKLNPIAQIKNLRDIILVGRFSYDGDQKRDSNDILIYGFAEFDKSMLGKRRFRHAYGDEGIKLEADDDFDSEFFEPRYSAIKTIGDFTVAGNGYHASRMRDTIGAYKLILGKASPQLGEALPKAMNHDRFKYEDANGHELETYSFYPERGLVPRLWGAIYSPYKAEDSSAILGVTKADSMCNPENSTFDVTLMPNVAKFIATTYGGAHVCSPVCIDINGWQKDELGAEQFQKELADLVFECIGDNAGGVASVIGHPRREYILNRK